MTTTIDLFRHSTNAQHFAAGSTIFKEGDPASTMYVIQSGEVEIRIRDKVLEILGEGGVFGEMALIEDAPRSATIVARTDCAVVPIDDKRFEFLITQTPNFAVRIMRIMSERLRAMHALALNA